MRIMVSLPADQSAAGAPMRHRSLCTSRAAWSLDASRLWSWVRHSHTVTTLHPRDLSSLACRRSRARFAANLAFQNALRVRGV